MKEQLINEIMTQLATMRCAAKCGFILQKSA